MGAQLALDWECFLRNCSSSRHNIHLCWSPNQTLSLSLSSSWGKPFM